MQTDANNPSDSNQGFADGSIVWLKSGSPDLTVTKVSGDDIRCIWGDQADMFKVWTLTPSPPQSN